MARLATTVVALMAILAPLIIIGIRAVLRHQRGRRRW